MPQIRFVYAGPGDSEAGALSKSGIAMYVDGEKVSGTIYRLEIDDGDTVTQHEFRETGEDLFIDGEAEVGIGKATSKMVDVARVSQVSHMSWGEP